MQLKHLLFPLAITITGISAAPVDAPVAIPDNAQVQKRCASAPWLGCVDVNAIISNALACANIASTCGLSEESVKAAVQTPASDDHEAVDLPAGLCLTDIVKEKEQAVKFFAAVKTEGSGSGEVSTGTESDTKHYGPVGVPSIPQHPGYTPPTTSPAECQKVYVPQEVTGGKACTAWTQAPSPPSGCSWCSEVPDKCH